jgi:hypothetical protein
VSAGEAHPVRVRDRVRQHRSGAVEAIGRQTEPAVKAVKDGIIARRGKNVRNIAKVAAAREMLEVVYYVLRDGQGRCLATAAPAA